MEAIHASGSLGHLSVRHRMAVAIAECERRYGLRLAGSWSTGEPHLPRAIGAITHSFSDMDLIAADELRPCQEQQARSLLADAANEVGLEHHGISIRLERSLTGLPHACGWCPNTLPHLLGSDRNTFLCFWTAIAAVEAAMKVTRDQGRHTPGVAAYVVTKFFFTLIRSVALVNGEVLSSYREVCAWINRKSSEVPIGELYGVKIGDLLELEPSWVELALGDRMLQALLGPAEAASMIAREMRAYWRESIPLDPLRYAQIAQEFAADEPARLALAYEMAKLKRTIFIAETSNAQ